MTASHQNSADILAIGPEGMEPVWLDPAANGIITFGACNEGRDILCTQGLIVRVVPIPEPGSGPISHREFEDAPGVSLPLTGTHLARVNDSGSHAIIWSRDDATPYVLNTAAMELRELPDRASTRGWCRWLSNHEVVSVTPASTGDGFEIHSYDLSRSDLVPELIATHANQVSLLSRFEDRLVYFDHDTGDIWIDDTRWTHPEFRILQQDQVLAVGQRVFVATRGSIKTFLLTSAEIASVESEGQATLGVPEDSESGQIVVPFIDADGVWELNVAPDGSLTVEEVGPTPIGHRRFRP